MNVRNLLLTAALLLSSTLAFAQTGGVKGRVVTRVDRSALDNVTVKLTPGDIKITTDKDGYFEVGDLPKGEYKVSFEGMDFEPLALSVRVDKNMRDMNQVVLVPQVENTVDDSIFGELDTESTGNDAQALPSMLSSSKDVFTNIASYKFGEMRFNARGYDSQNSAVYLNGVYFNDALTNYTPWSLWSGLNDATRNQETTTGLNMSDYGLGGLAGTTNINARASQMRKGFRLSLATGNQMYRFRAIASYSSGLTDKGWAYAFSVSTRQGGNDYFDGVFYNAFGYFGSVEKFFGTKHRLSLTVMGAPTERGAMQASTQEAYDLVGSNYYNPNWGYQNGKERNARVRTYHEPIAMLTYSFTPTERTKLDVTAAARFGQNGYSALNWKDGDPRPDYYRNLPSYYRNVKGNEQMAAQLEADWRANKGDISHINWSDIYKSNYAGIENSTYGNGKASNFIIEERHADQVDLNFVANVSHEFKNNMKVFGGATYRWNRTEYYTEVKDLLGGNYWVDIDKFATPLPDNDTYAQNNLNYYNKYGHALAAKEGDKFGYDYYANVQTARLWAGYNVRIGGIGITVAAEGGNTRMWREGLFEKGSYAGVDSETGIGKSFGNSEKLNYWTYKGKLNFDYQINAMHGVEFNAMISQDAPTFQTAFIAPRSRNQVTPNLESDLVWGLDAAYSFNYSGIKLRVAGFYTDIRNQNRVISYYDDLERTFVNFALSGINKRHLGVEFGMTIPLYMGISLNGAASYGNYTYTSNPEFVQIADNSSEILKASSTVYWKGMKVESTPQLATNLGLSYRSRNNWFASIDANFYNLMYLSMNPLYRTDEVLTANMSAEDMERMRAQEKFDPAFTLNVSVGKNWSIKRMYTIGFSLEGKNILHNTNIKTGGYEQMRLNRMTDSTGAANYYERFDSKYFYLTGATYYLNLYFRF